MAKSVANVRFEARPTKGGPDWMVVVTFPDAPEMLVPKFAAEADARNWITNDSREWLRRLGYGYDEACKRPRDPGRQTTAASKAADMAGEQIDRLTDPSASAEEQKKRKRRLTKGPSEFLETRRDLPKPKGSAR
jgi:hypothetical protein